MRSKLMALFSLIVVVVAVLGYALTRFAVSSTIAADPNEAPRALAAAQAKLAVEGLATESWLTRRAADPTIGDVFSAGTAVARSDSATQIADKIAEAANGAPDLMGIRPTLVLIVDKDGVVLGRNGSKQMRGDALGSPYPSVLESLKSGTSKTDVWVNNARNEKLFASIAPIKVKGDVVGAIVMASAIDDGRLSDASEQTSGHALIVGVKGDKGFETVAQSKSVDGPLATALAGGSGDAALQTLATGKVGDVSGLPAGYSGLARGLDGYGDAKRAVLIAVVVPATSSLGTALLWPAVVALLLGLIFVGIASFMLDNYISKPISEIEDGLLTIMNGQTSRRLELEHEEFGGLVFRINSLLNQLFGVAEDDTDEEGRPSREPSARDLSAAISVGDAPGPIDPKALFAEPEGTYYARLFREYIQAKRSVGDPTDAITMAEFTARTKASGDEHAQKQGKPVRFRVEVQGKSVVLVPLVEEA